jgi:hypothetical protein
MNPMNKNNTNNMNDCMNPLNMNNTNNMNDCMNSMNKNNTNNMNDCMNSINNAYYTNKRNMDDLSNMNNINMNLYNTNNSNDKMNINNMNSCKLNMNNNNINAKLNKPLSLSMMNKSTMNILNEKITSISLKNKKNNSQRAHFLFSKNQNDQSIIQNGGILPRTYEKNNNKVKEDLFFSEYKGNITNIIFETGAGLRYSFAVSENIPMKELLLKFIRKIGISESLMGSKILFILNGATIPANEERSIKDYFKEKNIGIANQSKIIVIDGSNVIGA